MERRDVGSSNYKQFTFDEKDAGGGGGSLGDRLGKTGRAEPIKVIGAIAAEEAARAHGGFERCRTPMAAGAASPVCPESGVP